MTEIERFWSKTKVSGSCILWTGHINKVSGYGYFEATDPTTTRHGGFKAIGAHRYIYQRIFGTLPCKIDVMHSCDVRSCVALQHLSPGSRRANMQDAASKGRTARGARRSKLTEEQVAEIKQLAAGGEAQTKIAARFGVHQVTIGRIVSGKRWKYAK